MNKNNVKKIILFGAVGVFVLFLCIPYFVATFDWSGNASPVIYLLGALAYIASVAVFLLAVGLSAIEGNKLSKLFLLIATGLIVLQKMCILINDFSYPDNNYTVWDMLVFLTALGVLGVAIYLFIPEQKSSVQTQFGQAPQASVQQPQFGQVPQAPVQQPQFGQAPVQQPQTQNPWDQNK